MISRLSEKQLAQLHLASVEILERTGLRLLEPEAVRILKRAGCTVTDQNRVRLPSHLVEWALRTAPKEVTLFDRSGQPAIYLVGRSAYYGNGSDLLYIIDHRTGERRRATLDDVRDMATLVDALPNLDFLMSGFLPSDVPPDQAQKWQMLSMIECSCKPIVYVTTDLQNTKSCIEMAELIAGSQSALQQRPFAVNYINISNPLRHNPESLCKLMWLSERGLPCVYRPAIVTRGISTPVTWAGFLAVNNVAGLAGLVLSQLVREGAPFIRCGCSGGTFDMHTMVGLHAASEIRGFNEDLAESYHLPRFGIGGVTGAKIVDQQAAYEAALTLITSTLAGAQLIHDVGYMDNGTTGALDQLIVCHEIIGWVKQYGKDLPLDADELALDVIDEVVSRDGDFLGTEHTLRHFREDFYPRLTERTHYDDWRRTGALTLAERARSEVDRLLDHRCEPLPQPVREKLGTIVVRSGGHR